MRRCQGVAHFLFLDYVRSLSAVRTNNKLLFLLCLCQVGMPATNLEYRFSAVEGWQYDRLPAWTGNDCSTPSQPNSPFPLFRAVGPAARAAAIKADALHSPSRMILRNALIVGCATIYSKFRTETGFNFRSMRVPTPVERCAFCCSQLNVDFFSLLPSDYAGLLLMRQKPKDVIHAHAKLIHKRVAKWRGIVKDRSEPWTLEQLASYFISFMK